MAAVENPRPDFAEAVSAFARIGLASFGGPAGQIAVMHRVLVEEKRWLDESRFLHALNYCMLLPGPEAQQLACYAGWLLHGTRGGIVAGALFVAPGALAMLVLSLAWLRWHGTAVVAAIGYGLKPAVVALVAAALVRVAMRAVRTRGNAALAVAAFLALAVGAPFPAVVVSALAFGLLRPQPAPADALPAPAPARGLIVRTALVAALWLALWLLPVAAVATVLGPGHVLVREGWFFSRAALITFGGAYAVLPYVADQAVSTYGWLRPDEMVYGLGLAETTPGPLVLVLEFVGAVAGGRHSGWTWWLGATAGAAMTCWTTFMPSYLWIFAGAPWIERARASPRLAGALAAVTAAVVGVIAHLGVWFALRVVFAATRPVAWGALTVESPVWSTFDAPALGLALLAGVALIRWRLALGWVLGGSVALGAAWWSLRA